MRLSSAAILLATWLPAQVPTPEGQAHSHTHLYSVEPMTGNWGGLRDDLEMRGIEIEAHYTLEVMSNVSGGISRESETLGNLDLLLGADLETLVGWHGASFLIYGLVNHGGNPSEAVGDAQIVSNIEAPETAKVYELWIEQEIDEGTASILFGFHDLNTEFDVIPAAQLFINSAHGIGSEFGTSGRNGPSIFPTTSLGVRVRFRPSEWSYVLSGIWDGVSGDPGDPDGTHVSLSGADGVLIASEVGVLRVPRKGLLGPGSEAVDELPPEERHFGNYGKLAVGVWRYTGEFDDFFRVDMSGNPVQRSGSFGAYALAQQWVYAEPDDPAQGLSVFARVGLADERVNVFDRYLGAGLVYRGLVPGRSEDSFGAAVAAARFGQDFQIAAAGGGIWKDWEVALELSYRAWVTPWFSLQPDLQYVVNPGGDPALDDAVVLGLRGVVSF